jgi:hypothetical protein
VSLNPGHRLRFTPINLRKSFADFIGPSSVSRLVADRIETVDKPSRKFSALTGLEQHRLRKKLFARACQSGTLRNVRMAELTS